MRDILVGVFRLLRGKYGLILLLLIGNLTLALFITADYGESIDEYGDFKYGEQALQTYVSSAELQVRGDRSYYGPFYLMLASPLSDVFSRLRPDWLTSEGRHFTNFLTFQMAVFFLYVLATRFVDRIAALAGTLIFCFQPLLFGHGFINQKDIPFMAFFTASVCLGLLAVDAFSSPSPHGESDGADSGRRPGELRRWIGEDWRNGSIRLKLGLLFSVVLAALIAFDLAGKGVIFGALQDILQRAYSGTAWGPITQLFQRIATDAYKTPLSLYTEKLTRAYLWLRLPFVVLVFLPAVLLSRILLRQTVHKLGGPWFGRRAMLILAGVVLGMCVSIRVAGPFAGALVSLAFLVRMRRRSFLPLAAYWATAGLTTFATWPFLWPDAFGRLSEAIRLMGDFPSHIVLYDGQLIGSGSLPWRYLPTLMGIELTEPALLLAVLGAAGSIFFYRMHIERRVDLAIVGLWFGLPAADVVFFRTPIYGNIRQVLFILPPLFIASAIGISQVNAVLKNHILQAVFLVLILFPGILAIVSLHPYEYIYYNRFIGGTDGAVSRYEIDPWCISAREATEYVDRVAAENAIVAISGPESGGVESFLRKDLAIEFSSTSSPTADFAIGCKRDVDDPSFHPEMTTVYEVRRGDAVLAVVKKAP